MPSISTIIFDLGGVLIDWNPRYVYRQIFKTEEEIDWFFNHICTPDWNENQDAGYPIEKATEEKVAEFPEWEAEIRAYYGRWTEMLGEAIHDTVEIFNELREKKDYNFYALTNWSAETFPFARERFEFLKWFDGIVVSGDEGLRKPFPEFYHRLLDRYEVSAPKSLFIDDSLRNVHAAAEIGMNVIHFTSPGKLRDELKKLELL